MLPAILHSLDWGHSTHVNCKIIQDDAVLLDKQSSWVQKAHRVDNEHFYEKYSLRLIFKAVFGLPAAPSRTRSLSGIPDQMNGQS